jgi:hypothetical protein
MKYPVAVIPMTGGPDAPRTGQSADLSAPVRMEPRERRVGHRQRMEAPMPYQHCPDCRLTVHLAIGDERDGRCPRCGGTLADEPRPLFRRPRPAPSADAVRLAMAARGGRFRREPPRVTGG